MNIYNISPDIYKLQLWDILADNPQFGFPHLTIWIKYVESNNCRSMDYVCAMGGYYYNLHNDPIQPVGILEHSEFLGNLLNLRLSDIFHNAYWVRLTGSPQDNTFIAGSKNPVNPIWSTDYYLCNTATPDCLIADNLALERLK